ncbi:MAG: hypothetical protein L3J35_01085 [Bacteroidales bacterium]|nr:hypothetical protein [Bacteroidales bacterium]
MGLFSKNRTKILLIGIISFALIFISVGKNDLIVNSIFLFKKSPKSDAPHNVTCNACHITHTSPGISLTSVQGNANLCMSCHNPLGTAAAKTISNADKAVPGVSGTSHSWDISAISSTYDAQLPVNPAMLSRILNDTIICSTCHNQHSQTYTFFLRANNTGDAICKDCHLPRNIGRYEDDNINNRGSHPVGLTYDGNDPRFFSSPSAPLQILDSKIECSSCHKLHFSATNDGNLLRITNDDNLCQSCHTYTGHITMGCNTCHQVHNSNKSNIYLIKDTISTPNSGNISVVFTSTNGTNSFADGDLTYDGICEACHTTTNYHQNNTAGNHTHNVGTNCINCHSHQNNFLHGGDCKKCHGHDAGYEYEPGLYCVGNGTFQSHSTHTEIDTDDLIGPNISCETCHDTTDFPYFISGTDVNADTRFDLSETDVCDNCHSPGGLFDGVNNNNLGAKNNWNNGIYSGNNLQSGKNNWCATCHDSDRASSNQDGTGTPAPDVAGDSINYGYYYSGHGKNQIINCTDCHDPLSSHLDGNIRTYTFSDAIANLTGSEYRAGYRLKQINGLEPMRIPLNDPLISQLDSANFRLCISCHNWDSISSNTVPYSTNFNHSGANAAYSFGYGVVTERNNHLFNHLDFQAHGRIEPYWDSDWDSNTTATVAGSSNPEVNGYDSYITCVTCHDVHGGQAFGGNTEGNMMRDGRLQNREPGLKFTFLIEAAGGLPLVTSVGANKENSIGGVIRSGVDYRAGYNDAIPQANAICGGCHSETYPVTDEYNASGNGGNSCTPCHPFSSSSNYYMEYYRVPKPLSCTLCHEQPPDGASFPNSSGSHETHMNSTKGPNISDCSVCHASSGNVTHINQIASFASGIDSDGNGNIELSETDVCNNCHSPGGTYDGVNDPEIGAKNNWQSGVYSGNDLTAGKEKWCATCHDENPANSMYDGTGIFASKVIGDESASYIYGTGYGYYKTGHGLPDTVSYPASGGVTSGAGLTCSACHDYSSVHIDHIQRTFNDGDVSTTSPSTYTAGYRLKLIGGLDPMQIPLALNTVPLNNSNQFLLCYSCHNSGPFLTSSDMNTNLVTDGINRHEYHLRMNQIRYSSDWDGNLNSRITCVSCHNVHGSKFLTMVRDGELIDSVPGLQIWYNNDAIATYNTSNPEPPEPQNIDLAASTGTVWIGRSSSNLCTHCHNNGNTTPEYRNPYQDVNIAPWLEWAGDLDFENDGVTADTAKANSDFLFRVNYFDVNNDFPSIYKMLADVNGDGITDSVDMIVKEGDNNFTDGSTYYKTINITRPANGSGNVDYKFYFVSTDSVATGEPTINHQFYVENNSPTLNWAGNLFFESDGIHPNTGPVGNFDFEIVYTDIDGDNPSTMNLIIDGVLPGYTMTAGTGSVVSGRTYSTTVSIATPGNHTYRFFAVDNAIWGDTAIFETLPVTNNSFTVTNTANNVPTLDYENSSCFTKSVMPVRGPVDGDYDFNIVYTDLDNEVPVEIKVVVDGTNEYPLSPISGNILTGMTYGTTIQINSAGEHYYNFYANDGIDIAIGEPTILNGDTLIVINALKVKLNDTRPGWYGSIQSAIDAFSDTIIMVYPDTYNEKLSFLGTGDDKIILEAVCSPENTIIDSTGNTIFIQNVPTYTKIIGFTVTGGTNGIYINNGKTEIIDCIIRNNTERGINSGNPGNILTVSNTTIRNNNASGTSANIYGAGIFFNGGTSHIISGCIIKNNHASVRGGGVYAQNISSGNLTLINTEVSDNISDNAGGGIGVNAANIVIDKCKIFSNTASGTSVAGGLFAQGTAYSVDITNSIFANNAGKDGGAFWFNSDMIVSIANSVFTENTTSDLIGGRGGALFTYDSDPTIINSIFWNNTAGSNYQTGHDCYAHQSGSVFTITYSDLINNKAMLSGSGTFNVGSNNIGYNPQFENPSLKDYRLKSVSPCIDIGTSVNAPFDDINGKIRGFDGRGDGNITGDSSDYDIGAYEYAP